MLRSVKRAAIALLGLLVVAACGTATQAGGPPPLVVGAVYPLTGPQAPGGKQEYTGVRAALALAERSGTLHRQVVLRVQSVETPPDAKAAVDRLIDRDHVSVIVGTYGSTLADAAAAEANSRHVIYWETGAVADKVTYGRPYVFRTVATGGTLGRTAVEFASKVLVPRFGLSQPTAAIVQVNDIYGDSVADAEAAAAAAAGIRVVDRIRYLSDAYDSGAIVARVAAEHPDFLLDVSYIDDGVAIWKSVLAQSWRPRAAIGTSSAFCMPQFGSRLGAGAIGVYAADKPDQTVSPNALDPAARTLLAQAESAYRSAGGGSTMEIPSVAGFVGSWVLFHDVLPAVRGSLTSSAVRQAALALNIPSGAEINGAGVEFGAPGSADQGQNLRAASMVAEWQGVDLMRVVYPPAYATGAAISMSPDNW